MKTSLLLFTTAICLASCTTDKAPEAKTSPLLGTWKMISAKTVKGSDSTVTDFTRDREFIKIITPTHFSFLNHDTNKGKDSATASFVAGGGRVTFGEGKYTEHLEYCNYREWEGGDFELHYKISNDTLVTTAIEKVEAAGVNQVQVETLVRVK